MPVKLEARCQSSYPVNCVASVKELASQEVVKCDLT